MDLKPKHCKPFWNKKIILLVSLVVIFAIGVGVTAAWLTGYGSPKTITLNAAYAKNNIPYTANGTDIYNIRVKNTGEVTGYIRIQQVFVWVKDNTDGTKEVLSAKPIKGEDFDTYKKWTDDQDLLENGTETNNWMLNETDGYYYHTEPVKPGDYTSYIVGQTALALPGSPYDYSNAYPLKDPPADGYRLEWTMVADIIQADPDADDWEEAWAKIDADADDVEDGVITDAKKATWKIPAQTSRPAK